MSGSDQADPIDSNDKGSSEISVTLGIPTLTVINTAVNANGGSATSGDFTIDISGTNVSSSGLPGSESGVTVTLHPGDYGVSESGGPPGYAISLSADCSGTIAVGEAKTCTIINDDIAPALSVIKSVVNDHSGSAVSSDFTIEVFGTNVSATGFPGSDEGVTVTLDPGSYSVGESGGPSDYAMSLSAHCSGTINLGDTKTCTITNDDIAPDVPILTVIKTMVNDNSGPGTGAAVASDFTIDIMGANVSNTGFAGSEAGVIVRLDPGDYEVSESGGPPGYAMSLSVDCSGQIALGYDQTCTITNDDIAPMLTVITEVLNDSGGILDADDFQLFVDGEPVISGIQVSLSTGPHTVAQGAAAGYSARITGDCAADGSVTLSPGGVAFCTVSDEYISPSLRVIKTMIYDNTGGVTSSAVASDFTIDILGRNVSNTTFPGSESGVTVTLYPGEYSVSESGGPPGYAMSLSDDCSGAIAVGEAKTCTITNADIGVDLQLSKTESIDPVMAGSGQSNLTYVVTVTNIGFKDATGVTISQALNLPDGVVVESITPSGVTTFDSTTNRWNVGDVASGGSQSLTVGLTVGANAVARTDAIGVTAAVAAVIEIDGDQSNDAISETTSVISNTPPTSSITAPSSPATFEIGEVIEFIGEGSDVPDGNLIGASLVWTSSVDGLLGTGESVKVQLSGGSHEITLTAIDSGGAVGVAALDVTIEEPVIAAAAPAGGGAGGGGGSFPAAVAPIPVPSARTTVLPVAKPTPTSTSEPTAVPLVVPTLVPTKEPTAVPAPAAAAPVVVPSGGAVGIGKGAAAIRKPAPTPKLPVTDSAQEQAPLPTTMDQPGRLRLSPGVIASIIVATAAVMATGMFFDI